MRYVIRHNNLLYQDSNNVDLYGEIIVIGNVSLNQAEWIAKRLSESINEYYVEAIIEGVESTTPVVISK